MKKKDQHFVPRTYLRPWSDDNKIYCYDRENKNGELKKIKKILFERYYYSLTLKDWILPSYKTMPLIYQDFVDQTFKLMREDNNKQIYALWNNKTIRSKNDISNYLINYLEWDFYYEKEGKAKNKYLKDQITSMKSLVLEDGLNTKFENDWPDFRNNFINAVEINQCNGIAFGNGYMRQATYNVLKFLFMMVCRNPNFDIFGVYRKVFDVMLKSLPEEIQKETEEYQKYYLIYRMLFDNTKGPYKTYLNFFENNGQIILYKTKRNSGLFITSDNPAFLYRSIPERVNMSGIFFPLTPQYLLFLGRGDSNIVRYGLADNHTINYFNKIILRNSTKYCISMPGYENVFV